MHKIVVVHKGQLAQATFIVLSAFPENNFILQRDF